MRIPTLDDAATPESIFLQRYNRRAAARFGRLAARRLEDANISLRRPELTVENSLDYALRLRQAAEAARAAYTYAVLHLDSR